MSLSIGLPQSPVHVAIPLRSRCDPSANSEADTDIFTCSLCGLGFTHGDRACRACPLASGCDVVACPGCGFQFPRASRIAGAIGGLWNRFRRRKK